MPNNPPAFRPLAKLALAGAATGLLLILAGVVWRLLAPISLVWSEEQAEQLAAATAAQHAAQHAHAHAHDHGGNSESAGDNEHAVPADELIAARARFESLSNDLEAARHLRDTLGVRLIQAGFALTALCGLGYLAAQSGD